MRSEVRTRANRVALNMTVPSVLSGMFIDTSRYNTHSTQDFIHALQLIQFINNKSGTKCFYYAVSVTVST